MKQSLLFISLLFYQLSFGQYKVDSSLKAEYWRVFERLPEKFRKEKDRRFKNGVGLLIGIKTDTLNKDDLQLIDTSLKVLSITDITGKPEPLTASLDEEETIDESRPMWLSCNCRLKGDTLEIGTGMSLFSGFAVISNLYQEKAVALYTEHETDGKVFKTKLTDEKVSQFTIPATIKSITVDRAPTKGIGEVYGKMDVATNGYYSYVNAWGFKHGYIYKRMRLEFYFRCDTPKQRTTSDF